MVIFQRILFCSLIGTFNVYLLLAQTIIPINIKAEVRKENDDWRQCCKQQSSYCHRNSCYFLLRRETSWWAAGNRCRSHFSALPSDINLLRLNFEEEKAIVRNLLARSRSLFFNRTAEFPTHFWMGGVRCSYWNETGASPINRWTTGDFFPLWLEKELEVSSSLTSDGCIFLVVSLDDNNELKYEFQDQHKNYAAACQFSQPIELDIEPSDSGSRNTSLTTKESDFTQKGKSHNASFELTSFSSMEILTTFSSDHFKTEEATIHSITSHSSSTTSLQKISDSYFIGCKARTFELITWPDTPAGEIAKVPCPSGIEGKAEWLCDKEKLEFVPEKPSYENCRHAWLVKLDREISEGKGDILKISTKLANKTKNNKLSHGDIFALVKLTEKLLELYEKENGMEHEVNDDMSSSYHVTQAIMTTYSHVLRSDVKRAWTYLDRSHRIRSASKIIMQTTAVAHHLSMKISKEDLQYTIVKENIDLQTFIIDYQKQKNTPYVFPKKTKMNENLIKENNILRLPGDIAMKKWLQSNFETTFLTAVGVIYKKIGKYLGTNCVNTFVATAIMGFSLGDHIATSVFLPQNTYVTIDMEHVESKEPAINARCVFWNFSRGDYGEWDSSGCWTLFTNKSHTRCSCSHLTNFAVLMDINNNIKSEDIALKYMTHICCGLSALALLVTLACLSGIRSLRCRRSCITSNLCLSLFFVDILIISGFHQTELKIACAAVAASLHFFLLSAFCWMLLEGYHLYYLVVVIFSQSLQVSMKWFYFFGYGVPAVIVAVSLSIRTSNYSRKDFCWLSNEQGVLWSFMGPACFVMVINLIVFVLTMKSASSLRIKKDKSTAKNAKSMVKGSMSIMCLLGLTWLVGFLYAIKDLYFSSYVFTFLNGLQGVFIFIFHIVLNGKAMFILKNALRKKINWSSNRTKITHVVTTTNSQH